MSTTFHRFIAVLIVAALIAVAACGKKGDPVLPDGQKDSFPKSYPQSTEPQTGIFSN
jgi:predicted small lipoprotein YifL